MKKQAMTALALVLFATPVFAEETAPAGGPPPHGAHGDGRGPNPDHFFDKVDTNKDNKISKEEFQAQGEKMFSEADTDHDGFITREEGKAAHEARKAKWKARKHEFMQKQTDKPE